MVGEGLYLIYPEKPDSVAQGCVTFHSAANTGQQHWVKLRFVPRAGGVTRLLSTTLRTYGGGLPQHTTLDGISR